MQLLSYKRERIHGTMYVLPRAPVRQAPVPVIANLSRCFSPCRPLNNSPVARPSPPVLSLSLSLSLPCLSHQVAGQTFSLPEVWFVFQQTKFVFTNAGDKQGFVRLEFPSEGSFQAYLGCRGLRDEKALAVAEERWGANVLDIPMPPFMKLFAEHAVAPFFVFQVRGKGGGEEGGKEGGKGRLPFEGRFESCRSGPMFLPCLFGFRFVSRYALDQLVEKLMVYP